MNGGNLIRAYRDENGFSLVEVVMATVILFFVSTALIGLTATATLTAMTAKQKNLMVNAVASYMEQIKGMDYDDIGVDGAPAGEVSGTLSDETTLTAEGFDITITPQVFWVDDLKIDGVQDYKLLRITVEAVPVGGGRSITYVTETQIRDVGMSWGWGDSPPTIEFGPDSPEEMEVVSGSSVLVRAVAESPLETRSLVNMYFYCDVQYLRHFDGTTDAMFFPNAQTADESFYWDTLATMEDEFGNPVLISPDGIRSIRIHVWDNLGEDSFKIRRVLVDNFPPNLPDSPPWVDWATDEFVNLDWDQVMDGSDPAMSYGVLVDEDQGTGVWVLTDERCDPEVTDVEYDLPVYTASYEEPFRRFRMWLRAQSPRFESSYVISDPFISPPLLSGEWKVLRTPSRPNATCETTNTLYWSAPQFPVSTVAGAFKYTLWRATDPSMTASMSVGSWTATSTVSFSEYIEIEGKKIYAVPYYYQLQTSLVPTGPDNDGSTVQVWSNVAGPNGTDTGAGEMTETW